MTRSSERWIRSARAAVADAGGHVYLIARDGAVRRIEGDSAALAREVVEFLGAAHTTDEILTHVESLAGPLGDRRSVVTDLVAHLAETGAISPAPSGSAADRRQPPMNIVVAISGAIAATHAPALVLALQRRGHAVEVALPRSAQRFVAVDALAAIAGREIHTTLWPPTPHAAVPHVALAEWADLVVVYPASATTLGRLAAGDFSDLVSALALTTRAPVVLAPSMNGAMLAAPAVQRNLAQLRGDRFVVLAGVPSQEVADAPAVRGIAAGAAAAPGEIAATIDALRTAGVLVPRGERGARAATTAADWDAMYRARATPWASAECDADIAAALDETMHRSLVAAERDIAPHASPCEPAPKPPQPTRVPDAAALAPARLRSDAAPSREPVSLLDIGCGLGQVARHAASRGHRVVATDLSGVALRAAASLTPDGAVMFVRDDICATSLIGPFDVIVDRAVLHALPPARVHAWAAAITRLAAPGATVIVKAHRDGISGVTTGWSAADIAERLPGFELVREAVAELPSPNPSASVPAVLAVLRRR
jgi:2-polyprenyl-3-methyl-5-hydroxy-6-metoxy-1,4-benzoquinol methylase